MNLSQRLRKAMRYTRLDSDRELLTEAADEIDRLSASAALPTLRPGDSHMESLIEAAIQGHASTRDAMRWLVRQLVPATPEPDEWKLVPIVPTEKMLLAYTGGAVTNAGFRWCRHQWSVMLAAAPAAPAAPAAHPAPSEPVAWMASYVDPVGNDHVYVTSHRDLAVENDMHGEPKPLYTHPAPQTSDA